MAGKRIDEHTIRVLEYDAVLRILASYASSTLGRDAATALYPSVDRAWVAARMAETTEMKALLEVGSRLPLAGLRDIRLLLREFGKKETMFEPAQLLEIADTLAVSGRTKAFLEEFPQGQFTALQAIGEGLEDFTELTDQIDHCIGGDKTVRDEASGKLKDVRRTVALLSEKIRQRFAEIVASPHLRSAIENDKFLMRHGRPVIAIKAHYRNVLHGTILDRSNTGATVYIEPDALVELSNDLEDALFEEKKEVERILWELTHAVLRRREGILRSVRTLGWIDLTYAKARFSIAYSMSAPAISNAPALQLRRARHPLLLALAGRQKECDVSGVMADIVPIDVRLGEDFDLLLVTGPNTGGKTVVLKTIGLLNLMAQSGMHIPAGSDSKVPVYKQIHADIGDEQSIEQSLSTFSAHIRQVVHILEKTTAGTLVVIDELGAGTDPAEGAVLATSILEALLRKGAKVVATTHLGQLKSYAYTAPRSENASVQFDIETLRPTFELLIGTPGSSNALAIARRLGMPELVVGKAQTLLDGQTDGTATLINQVQTTRQLAEKKRTEADALLEQAKQMSQQASAELEKVRAEGELLRQQADMHIDESMRAVRRIVEDFTRRMQNAPKSWSTLSADLAQQVAGLAASTPLAVRHAQFIDSLRRGDTVYVIPFKAPGLVDRIHKKRGTIVVFVDSKQVELPFAEVCRPPQAYSA